MNFEPHKEYIAKLLSEEGRKFIIPEYQRLYRWGKEQCETLWNDIIDVFGDGENIQEYFLGSIVAYENDKNELEIIDGQQRITTLTLLFRAFYECFKTENNKGDYPRDFGECIWEYQRDKGFEYDKYHLKSEVATDKDAEILKLILSDKLTLDEIKKDKSKYAENYIYFYNKLIEFKQNTACDWKGFCNFILGQKLFILFIKCDNQESAMTIFNTLNSRGLPLSNADILKGHIYQKSKDRDKFTNEWRDLETKIEENETAVKNLDFLFLEYMHIIRAINEDSNTTTPGVLDFFTKKIETQDKEDIKGKKACYGSLGEWLYKDETMPFIANLADFWINYQNYLSDLSCKYMSVLNLFQNASWKSFVSCLVWKNKHYFESENFDKESFSKDFEVNLAKLIKFITIPFLNNNASTSAINEIVFKLNVNLFKNQNLETNQTQKYDFPSFEIFCDYSSKNDSKKTKYLLLLNSYIYDDFKDEIDLSKLEVEHILPKQWQNANFNGWDKKLHEEYLEQIGNKILLEKKLNIKCTDGFFARKQTDYKNSHLKEVKDLGENREKTAWLKEDIEARNKEIYNRLRQFFEKHLA